VRRVVLENTWAPFFLKPEKALVESEAVAAQTTSPEIGTGFTAGTDTAKMNQATN